MRPAWASAGAAALLLVGCTVGPRYQPPPPPRGAEAPFVSTRPDSASPETPPQDWWRLYQDPVLDALVRRALAANEDLRAAQAHLEAARAQLRETYAQRLLQTGLGASATYGRPEIANLLAGDVGARAQPDWFDVLEFDAALPLDLFGGIRRGIEASRADAQAAEAARDQVRVAVAAGVAGAYADACALGRSIVVAETSRQLAERILQATQRRHEAGVDTTLDLARARALVAQTASAIPPLQGQKRAALFVLTALLGAAPAETPPEAEACSLGARLSSPLPVGDGAALLRRRPDLRQAERELAAATARIGVATAALYPSVTLAGSVSVNASTPKDFGAYGALAWGTGPLISWTFPNTVAVRARIRAARADADGALARFDGAILKALSETEQALAAYASELDRRRQLQDSRDRSAEALRLAGVQRAEGALPYLDLLSAEQTLIAADSALAASDRQIVADQVAVFRSLGGGWAAPAGS